jgi:hypothetical protein
VAQDDAYSTGYATPLLVDAPGVLGNDADVDGDPLTATQLPGTLRGGALKLNLDGSLVYTPSPAMTMTAGFSGLDQFLYFASDGKLVDVATASIDVGLVPTFTLTVAQEGSGSGTVEPGVGQHVH